jgi:hypothetical protein
MHKNPVELLADQLPIRSAGATGIPTACDLAELRIKEERSDGLVWLAYYGATMIPSPRLEVALLIVGKQNAVEKVYRILNEFVDKSWQLSSSRSRGLKTDAATPLQGLASHQIPNAFPGSEPSRCLLMGLCIHGTWLLLLLQLARMTATDR